MWDIPQPFAPDGRCPREPAGDQTQTWHDVETRNTETSLNMYVCVKHARWQQQQLAHRSWGETLLIPVGKLSHYGSKLQTALCVTSEQRVKNITENYLAWKSTEAYCNPDKIKSEGMNYVMHFWHVILILWLVCIFVSASASLTVIGKLIAGCLQWEYPYLIAPIPYFGMMRSLIIILNILDLCNPYPVVSHLYQYLDA